MCDAHALHLENGKSSEMKATLPKGGKITVQTTWTT